MVRKIFIYGLKHLGSEEYRYIGRTFTPKKRLGEHLREKSLRNYYKRNWIEKSKKDGVIIILDIIEVVNEINWREREKFYIKFYKDRGHRLTNLSDGGEDFYREFKFNITYDKAKELIKDLNIKTTLEWRKKAKLKQLPFEIPKRPDLHYLDNGWVSWSDWLGVEIVSNKNKEFLNYVEAKIFVHTLNIKSNNDWRIYCKSGLKPNDIPSNPDSYYETWISWSDWLGYQKENVKSLNEYLSYTEARNYVCGLGLKNHRDWVKYSKTDRPNNIPANPWKYYKEWNGITNFIKK